ncbi:MAG TPA: (d)CMP kinase [Candidatus Limnocylindria bacterium]|nr:(d)CMP kinase [Candidatus Limnocylindria bacterium]
MDRDHQRREAAEALVVTIDGPAAAGKSTVASEVASRIDALYFDTGVVYRALALAALERGIAPGDGARLAELATDLDLRVTPPTQPGRLYDVWLDGRDVTQALRQPAVDHIVSEVSAHPSVRQALLALQRQIGRSGPRVVMVGRDIGTVVMPHAQVKIWLEASLEERARRRWLELERQGGSRQLAEVRAEMERRDRADGARPVAPMRPAPNAVVIDTDGKTIEEVAGEIVALARARLPADGGAS